MAQLEANEEKLRHDLEAVHRLLRLLPQSIYVFDVHQRSNIYANGDLGLLLGYSPDEIRQMGSGLLTTLMHPDDLTLFEGHASQYPTLADGQLLCTDYRLRRPGGTYHWIRGQEQVFSRTGDGAVATILGIAHDLTEERRAEAERAVLREQVIAAQSATLREIGTPLIPIADGVVAMPLVGAIDEERADRILDVLLNGITHRGARLALLDVTGAKDVDARVAAILLRVTRAASLLGAQVVLTGIQPVTARLLVETGADLGQITTRATLQEGITFALKLSPR
ncbi:RsbR, positive regulator of sigma-B [Chondromyces apiculatus DSM 436]|uniref:RsbR, positive regulator of sigma-B n=1 Tax=Chondromyces apiculatus DSM 436 TaxID=1192034 RepID=A0A017T7B6_9BACT|nr:RsbR, positive regulator of sigma-B [Chondromyces apiculatus DSM 436]